MKRDPITFEVIKNSIIAAAEEMEIVLLKSAYSPIIKELLDASSAICDSRGRVVAQAIGIPLHLGGLAQAIRSVIQYYPPETIKDGDVFLLNDPYSGAMHLPDFITVTPIFGDGKLLVFTMNLAHQSDVGGMAPGSSPGDATDIFQEGFCIPPTKIQVAGKPNETLMRLLERNVRAPEVLFGDLRAQMSANMIGGRRIVDLMHRYGRETLVWYMNEILDYTERMTRNEIKSRLASGVYTAESDIDDDGITDKPFRVKATVTVDGDTVAVNFAGTDPQARGAINATASSTIAATQYAMKCFLDPRIPANEGCYRPLKISLPEGSLVDAQRPAAVNARAIPARRASDVVLDCLSQASPQTAIAQSSDNPYIITIGGLNERTGRFFLYFEAIAGGMGARCTKDGEDAIDTHTTNCKNLPVEAGELEFPLLFRRLEIVPDSGGDGQFRGGLGICKEIEALQDAVLGIRGDRVKFPAHGLAGGEPGAPARIVLTKNGIEEVLPSKKSLIHMRRGDRVVLITPGGGGYGDPAQRSAEAVAEDVADGRVTRAPSTNGKRNEMSLAASAAP